jgi:hypothetical protein
MKKTRTVTRTEEVTEVTEVLCNKCGAPMPRWDDGGAPALLGKDGEVPGYYGLVEQMVGGGTGSKHLIDCTSYTFSVCEACLVAFFHACVIPPQIGDMDGECTWEDDRACRSSMDASNLEYAAKSRLRGLLAEHGPFTETVARLRWDVAGAEPVPLLDFGHAWAAAVKDAGRVYFSWARWHTPGVMLRAPTWMELVERDVLEELFYARRGVQLDVLVENQTTDRAARHVGDQGADPETVVKRTVAHLVGKGVVYCHPKHGLRCRTDCEWTKTRIEELGEKEGANDMVAYLASTGSYLFNEDEVLDAPPTVVPPAFGPGLVATPLEAEPPGRGLALCTGDGERVDVAERDERSRRHEST